MSKPRPVTWKPQPAPYPGLSDCHICTSHAHDINGYPKIHRGGVTLKLSRLVCEGIHGPLGSLMARHVCDVRACINPDHLIPGTHADNTADMVSRGRQARGSRHGSARLPDAMVEDIMRAAGTDREVAAAFGVTAYRVYQIRNP